MSNAPALPSAIVLLASLSSGLTAAERPAMPNTFAICSSGEVFHEYPKLFPLMHEAGVTMARQFPEWSGIEPQRGVWNWQAVDELVAGGRANRIQIFGCLSYLAPWASANGGTRRFPIKDMTGYSEFAEAAIGRYKDDIIYWEVYNEFNGGFAENGTVKDYVLMVQAADAARKKVNPKAKIGIGCADVDISFLEQVIAEGGAGCFDFVNVHPYSLIDHAMGGRETVFLRMGANLRAMLDKTHQRPDIELCASEIGITSTNDPKREATQAEGVVKASTLCMGQGISKVFWFEGHGPAYGKDGSDFGLLRPDWSKRPSYTAMRTMTGLLGAASTTLGWLDPTGKCYGFVFQGATEPVLVTWAMTDAGDTLTFPGAVTLTDLAGTATTVASGAAIALTRTPVFITGLPAASVATARANGGKPFPWLKDFSGAASIACRMGAANVTDGLSELNRGDGLSEAGLVDGVYARRTLKGKGSEYMYFDADDSYAGVGDHELTIAVTARPVDAARGASFNLTYEGTKGYRDTTERWTSKEGTWTTTTFVLKDANFANNWGWNFRLRTVGSPSDVWIKDVVVTRSGAKR